MNFCDVSTSEDLRRFMTEPSERLVQFMASLDGAVIVLGAGGKMGPELVEMMVRADREAGVHRPITAASTFRGRGRETAAALEELGATVCQGDLCDASFLVNLPEAPNVIYMAGMKFGSSSDWAQSFHMNCIMPYEVAGRYVDSRIVVFSSANPYAPRRPADGGSTEQDTLKPEGIYGWCIAARESAFTITARRFPNQRSCFFRLVYAQHLAYGVLADLAGLIWREEPVSLRVPAVNLVSQRDANDVAIRSLGRCANPPFVLNVAGPMVGVRDIADKLAQRMGKAVRFEGEASDTAVMADDGLCLESFGAYRDTIDQMVDAAARWVEQGGENWGKPTMFDRADAGY